MLAPPLHYHRRWGNDSLPHRPFYITKECVTYTSGKWSKKSRELVENILEAIQIWLTFAPDLKRGMVDVLEFTVYSLRFTFYSLEFKVYSL